MLEDVTHSLMEVKATSSLRLKALIVLAEVVWVEVPCTHNPINSNLDRRLGLVGWMKISGALI